ncbi:MAG: OmpA family protein [Bacteroidota bacterium]
MRNKLVIAILALAPIFTNAQLSGLLKKIKNKVDQRADKKVNEAIDNTLDQVEGKKKDQAPGPQPAVTAQAPVSVTDEPVKSFAKYDFIPGEKILYSEDFAGESIGELPTGWNTSGSGEVVTLEKSPGKWLRVHHPFTYLTANTKEFTENYTAEFDLILQLKNNGWMYPPFSCGFFATNGKPGTDNSFLKEYNKNAAVMATIYPAEFGGSRVVLESFSEAASYFKSEPKPYSELEKNYGKPVHIAIQVQKERFRMWINETKVFDVPKAVGTKYKLNQLFFNVGHTNYNEEQYGIYLSNIKMATGAPDTRHKLIDEGRFSTTGILFDFASAVIKPGSFGVISEIGTALKDNQTVKIKVIGHTSNDGDDNANMELSKRRAAAVKDLLVTEFGVAAASIETEGKGETQPVTDNNTQEGKMANRRVEFIKL